MALPKMKIKQQCREFSQSGERCKLPAVDGMEVCPSHAVTLKRDSGQRAPLTASTPKREVLRRVDRALRLGWPEIKFTIRPGISLGGREILVALWVDGPTVEEVQEVVAALYSQVTREWGQSKGAPDFECSRDYTPDILIVAMITHAHRLKTQGNLIVPDGEPERKWVREILVGALDILLPISHPERNRESFPSEIAEYLSQNPLEEHEEGLSSFEWQKKTTLWACEQV